MNHKFTTTSTRTAAAEFLTSSRLWRLWSAFAWEDVKSTYKRSAIGVLWVAVSFSAFVAVKNLIFGSINNQLGEAYFTIYLLLGFFSWQFMAQIINTAPTIFIRAENWLTNDPLPPPIFMFQNVARSLFDLLLTGCVVLLGLFITGYTWDLVALLAIPALLLYVINALWVTLLLGIVCTRYRDIQHLLAAGMRILFFMSPVFWMPSQLDERVMSVLWWNPLAQFIWIFRTPILDQEIPVQSFIYTGIFTLAGCFVTFMIYSLTRRRITFWF